MEIGIIPSVSILSDLAISGENDRAEVKRFIGTTRDPPRHPKWRVSPRASSSAPPIPGQFGRPRNPREASGTSPIRSI
jgi:hypothetical protein